MAILLALLVMSCSEIVDLNVDKQSYISIYGRFNNGTLGNQVEILRTSSYDLPPTPISSASVKVYNREGEFISFKESSEEQGIYEIENQTFVGRVGQEYRLEISLLTGETYQSDWQKLPAKRAIDHLDFEVGTVFKIIDTGQEFEFLGTRIFYETELLDNEKDIYLRWDVETTWFFREAILPPQFFSWVPDVCYMTTQLEEEQIRLFSSKRAQAGRTPRQLLVEERIDNTFFGKQYFSLIQSTMNEQAFNFWSRLEETSDIQGSIFDPPFGPIVSNIKRVDDAEELVLGFFEVNHVDTARIELNQTNVDVELAQPCKIPLAVQSFPSSWFNRLGAFFQESCLDCLVIPNSSLEKPYFWND